MQMIITTLKVGPKFQLITFYVAVLLSLRTLALCNSMTLEADSYVKRWWAEH
jgi:hypothetical protein